MISGRGQIQRGPSPLAWACWLKLTALATVAPVAAVFVGAGVMAHFASRNREARP